MTEPISFVPLYMDRIWGGRRLETLYGRRLPQEGVPYGESWELVDRENEQSVVANGALAGKTLHELWSQHRREVFGGRLADHPAPRFPLLIKILDAVETLSIQVHPPASVAPALKGEPKTEMWVITEATPEASLYVGVKPGTTQESFEQALALGTVEESVHQLPAKAGDFIFIPSGRLHAIGAGLVIFEIQQNSDTTYRVFDFNRLGLDGKPRALHVNESLQCIDFTDTKPSMDQAQADGTLVSCDYFTTKRFDLTATVPFNVEESGLIAVTQGLVSCGGKEWPAGSFFWLPPGMSGEKIVSVSPQAQVLFVTL